MCACVCVCVCVLGYLLMYMPSFVVVTTNTTNKSHNVVLEKLHTVVSKQQNVYPDGAVIVAGCFNHVDFKKMLPKFHKNVITPTRGINILDQVYTNIPGAYKAIVSPHLGLSDHVSLMLIHLISLSSVEPNQLLKLLKCGMRRTPHGYRTVLILQNGMYLQLI